MHYSTEKTEKENKAPVRKIILLVIIFLLVGVLGFSGYKVISGMNNYRTEEQAYEDIAKNATSETEEKVVRKVRRVNRAKIDDTSSGSSGGTSSGTDSQPEEEEIEVVDLVIDYETLFQQNSDVAGWIYCEGTQINYPIVRGSDNDYYLNHRFDGVYSSFGSIFMDYRCSKEFTADNTLIYGHHMDNGSMFAAIVNYKSQSFYNAHPYMVIYTPSGDYLLELFAGYTAATDDICYTTPVYGGNIEKLIDHAMSLSTFKGTFRPSASENIITLSTCAYDFKNARYVLLGVLTPLL